MDLYSRKIVGWEVHETDDSEHAVELVRRTAMAERISVNESKPVLHGDNGSTLKATTVLALLYRLGIKPSYSRPRVSDDNAYAEALFRTANFGGAPRRSHVEPGSAESSCTLQQARRPTTINKVPQVVSIAIVEKEHHGADFWDAIAHLPDRACRCTSSIFKEAAVDGSHSERGRIARRLATATRIPWDGGRESGGSGC